MLRDMFETDIDEYDPQDYIFSEFNRSLNRKIKVKVYSNFLKDIVNDLGFTLVTGNHHYLVYPDYIKNELFDEIITMGDRAVEVPSHKNAPKNPLKRAEIRYKLLEKKLCTKP
jgi:predicted MPP superfamily phosphohydrolase